MPRAKKDIWKAPFLEALRRFPCVAAACRAANVGRTTVYFARRDDPEFAEGFEVALVEACDALEGELMRRATSPWRRVEIREEFDAQGKLLGTVKTTITGGPSDRLLMFLLRGLRPEKWGNLDAKKVAELVVSMTQAIPPRAIEGSANGKGKGARPPDLED